MAQQMCSASMLSLAIRMYSIRQAPPCLLWLPMLPVAWNRSQVYWKMLFSDIGVAFPTRRRILELLRAGDMTAGELAEHFDISKPIVQPSSGDAQERRSCNGRTAWAEHRV
ncbi:MAG: ArsR family transcriptional regulator [Bifidobacterium angulatum]